jgi:4-hydroxy-tetrahydrodipicolinate synthase
MKDTCCDAKVIAERVAQLKGSNFKLLNANAQTLLESMRSGANGYCGIMCNYHPKLYAWLSENYEKEPEKVEAIQGVLGSLAFTEVGLPYPLSAKYHMCLCGIETSNIARNRKSEELTDYARSCIKQMKTVTDNIEKQLNI